MPVPCSILETKYSVQYLQGMGGDWVVEGETLAGEGFFQNRPPDHFHASHAVVQSAR